MKLVFDLLNLSPEYAADIFISLFLSRPKKNEIYLNLLALYPDIDSLLQFLMFRLDKDVVLLGLERKIFSSNQVYKYYRSFLGRNENNFLFLPEIKEHDQCLYEIVSDKSPLTIDQIIDQRLWYSESKAEKAINNDDVDELNNLLSANALDVNQRCKLSSRDGMPLVSFAAFISSTKCFKFLLMNGADPSAINQYGFNAFHMAIAGGNFEIIQILNEEVSQHEGALCIAEMYFQKEIAEWLVECQGYTFEDKMLGNKVISFATQNENIGFFLDHFDESIKEQNRNNFTPFLSAVSCGWLIGTEIALEHGANMNDANIMHQKPLMLASLSGNLAVVKTLVEHGADVNEIAPNTSSSIFFAVTNGNTSIFKYLVDHGADLSIRCSSDSILTYAIQQMCNDIVEFCLEKGMEISDRACAIAANQGYSSILKMLIDHGIDPNLTVNGNSLLVFALSSGSYSTVKTLIDAGVDLNHYSGPDPISFASQEGNKKLLKLFIESGVDIDHLYQGATPLMRASAAGSLEVVKMLVENGANVHAKIDDGTTPIMFASNAGHYDVVEYLLDAGADPNHRNNNGSTALMFAAAKNHPNVLRLLIRRGGNVNIADNKGFTALMQAITRQNIYCIAVLGEHESGLY